MCTIKYNTVKQTLLEEKKQCDEYIKKIEDSVQKKSVENLTQLYSFDLIPNESIPSSSLPSLTKDTSSFINIMMSTLNSSSSLLPPPKLTRSELSPTFRSTSLIDFILPQSNDPYKSTSINDTFTKPKSGNWYGADDCTMEEVD